MSANTSLPSSLRSVRVRLEKPPRWLEVELALDGQWEGGSIVAYRDSEAVKLDAADELSRTYDLRTWESGIASGAFYAFRTLERPRQRVVITDLQGSLGSDDMTALAEAAAMGVAKLLEDELPDVDVSDWKVSVSTSDNANQPS